MAAGNYELSNCLWIPRQEFTKSMQDDLTVDLWNVQGELEGRVHCYVETKKRIGLPRHYGLEYLQSIAMPHDDLRSRGQKVKYPKQITLKDYQVPVVDQMVEAAETESDFKVSAATGKGKTVMALAFIAKLGRNAVIVVDQEDLLKQWIERCLDPELLGLSEDDIGVVRSDKCEYKDKKIVIAMVQSLAQRDYPEEFYDYFGVAVWDEAHTAGAPTFSQTFFMFSSYVRIGVSATIKRRGPTNKILDYNLGEVLVSLEAEHEESNLYVLNFDGVVSWAANASKLSGRYINELAGNGLRNLMIANTVAWLWLSGRRVLVIGDRVSQLTALQSLCKALGIPEKEMGLFSKQTSKLVYIKDPKPPRRPPFWEKGTEYTPVKLDFVQKTLPKDYRERVKKTSPIIFSTYGTMAKGVDIPDLSAGIDITPRSEATQVHGRILRENDKLIPIWVTIADTSSYRAMHQLGARLREYVKDNAEVYLWNFHKGRKLLNERDLARWVKLRKSELQQLARIGTRLDGSNIITSPPMQTDSDNLLGNPIDVRTPEKIIEQLRALE